MVTTETEYHFLVEHQKGLNNNQKYWIGGSTRAKGNIMFSYYFPYEKGAGEMGINVSVLMPLQIQTVFNNAYFIQALILCMLHQSISPMTMKTFRLLLVQIN